MYFNIARILYLQVDNVFGLFLLFPSIVAGTITLGLMTQITNVLVRFAVLSSTLINSWTTLVELMSIYKRLRSFEHELDGDKIQGSNPYLELKGEVMSRVNPLSSLSLLAVLVLAGCSSQAPQPLKRAKKR